MKQQTGVRLGEEKGRRWTCRLWKYKRDGEGGKL